MGEQAPALSFQSLQGDLILAPDSIFCLQATAPICLFLFRTSCALQFSSHHRLEISGCLYLQDPGLSSCKPSRLDLVGKVSRLHGCTQSNSSYRQDLAFLISPVRGTVFWPTQWEANLPHNPKPVRNLRKVGVRIRPCANSERGSGRVQTHPASAVSQLCVNNNLVNPPRLLKVESVVHRRERTRARIKLKILCIWLILTHCSKIYFNGTCIQEMGRTPW